VSALFDVLSGLLLIGGALLALIASVGLHRLPDTLARMHAATKPATLGVTMCAVGAMIQTQDASTITKILVIVIVQLVAAPVGAHVLGRAIRNK
jgi:multicomponent Na+:H+ antiporter subunit G